MAKSTKNHNTQQNSAETEQEGWHAQGRWWLALGGVGVILVVGFVVFLVSDSSALSASISVIVGALLVLLELLDLNHPLQRLSHHLGRSRRNQVAVMGLLVITGGIWLFLGGWQLRMSACGALGCKSSTVVVRFAFDQWTSQGQSAGLDGNLSIATMREALFQKLSCVNGFQPVDPYTETILNELDLLINGNLRIQPDIELAIQLINPKARARLQSVTERQPWSEDQTQLELTLLTLQNNLFQKIVRAINIQLQPENAAFVSRIPTDNPEALRLNNQAVALILHRQLDQAAAQLEKAIAYDPRYADAYNNLGQLYRQRGDLRRAIEQYELATELLPCIALYHYNLGFAYEEDQQYDNAIAAYKAAITRNPAYGKAFNNLGFVYLQTGRLAEAEQYLQQGIAIDPSAAYLYKNLGRVYLAQGRPTEAIAQIQAAVTLFPDYAEARYFLAEAYRQAGQPQNACDQLAAYMPLAATDATDDPARVQSATVLSTTLSCSTRGATP